MELKSESTWDNSPTLLFFIIFFFFQFKKVLEIEMFFNKIFKRLKSPETLEKVALNINDSLISAVMRYQKW